MGKIITLKDGERDVIDFSKDDAFFIPNLEACLAVGGTKGDRGVAMHVTQASDYGEYLDWFKSALPPTEGNRMYLVGGRKGMAEEFVELIRTGLIERGYESIKEDLLKPNLTNMYLEREKANLHYIVKHRTPEGMPNFTVIGASVL